jgi:arabinosaccharide transport system permease protein
MFMIGKNRALSGKSGVANILYSQKISPYVFILPFVISFLVFFLASVVQTVNMSFHKVIGLNDMEFIGLRNYARLNNPHFFNALKTNTIYTILCICVMIPTSTILAVFLNTKFIRGRNVFRAIFFIPSLTSVIAAGVSFRLIFGTLPTSLANSFLGLLNIEPVNWTISAGGSYVILLFLGVWRVSGIYMIYVLSALQMIPEELYESAEMDGAGPIGKLLHVTLPLIKPITVYILTLVIFEGYRMFSESYVFWTEGMPGDIGLTITRYIHMEAFRQNDMGLGSAIGITSLLIVLVINVIQLNSFGLFRKEK